VRIVVHSFLRRLRDADGTSSKYIVDAIVGSGLLPGDGPETVTEIVHRQTKANEDRTVISIYRSSP
jgi:hypothetical protein